MSAADPRCKNDTTNVWKHPRRPCSYVPDDVLRTSPKMLLRHVRRRRSDTLEDVDPTSAKTSIPPPRRRRSHLREDADRKLGVLILQQVFSSPKDVPPPLLRHRLPASPYRRVVDNDFYAQAPIFEHHAYVHATILERCARAAMLEPLRRDMFYLYVAHDATRCRLALVRVDVGQVDLAEALARRRTSAIMNHDLCTTVHRLVAKSARKLR
ncbi:hypothetical protein FB107DRAFT_276545 [Schizophyllum commune]